MTLRSGSSLSPRQDVRAHDCGRTLILRQIGIRDEDHQPSSAIPPMIALSPLLNHSYLLWNCYKLTVTNSLDYANIVWLLSPLYQCMLITATSLITVCLSVCIYVYLSNTVSNDVYFRNYICILAISLTNRPIN